MKYFGYFWHQLHIPVVRRHRDLIPRATPQVLNRVLLRRRRDLYRIPVTKLGLVAHRVAMDGFFVVRVGLELHGDRIGGGGCELNLREMRGCWGNRWNEKYSDPI